MINKIRRWVNNQNWNIGFIDDFTPEELIETQKLPNASWMKHPYNDRTFADPFILDCDNEKIIILCEELQFGHKGIISKLIISRKDYQLTERKEILQLNTHLSYPAIIRQDDKIFIYPENSESGHILIYKYDPQNDNLSEKRIIADGDFTDFTVCLKPSNERYYALSTKLSDDSQQGAYLLSSKNLLGPYDLINGEEKVITDRACSRQGGNFFEVNGEIFRPAQNCVGHYGKALKIMKVDSFEPYRESEQFELRPQSYKYNLGIHTLNFYKDLTVIDGYGYLHSNIGRVLGPLNQKRISLIQKSHAGKA